MEIQTIKIISPAFENNGLLPKQYTCDGQNVSPPLALDTVPIGTKSLALICDDPDAPSGDWVHWVIFNLPADTRELPENIPAQKILENNAKQGINDFPTIGYQGPCPPIGVHRYFFKIYALDIVLDIESGITKVQLLKAIDGHILGQGQLISRYQRIR